MDFNTVTGPLLHTGGKDPDASTCWPFQVTNGSSTARTFVERNTMWYTRIPEYVELQVAGLRFAGACPGDIVRLTSSYVAGPEGAWVARPAMIQSIQRDWNKGTVTLGLAAIPTSGNRFK
jgi:hypothetical protein